MSLHLENELTFRIDRQKPWTSVRYKSRIGKTVTTLDSKAREDLSLRSEGKKAEFLLLDDGVFLDGDNNCRASHVYRTGQSDKSLLEKKMGSRFMSVQASRSGEYACAYTKKGELVIWNTVNDTIETFPGPFISKQEVNNRAQNSRFKKATEEAYKNLKYQGGVGASQGDLWIFHKGGFFAYQGGQWMHLLNDFHETDKSTSTKEDYANNFKFNVHDDEALDFGSFTACYFSSPLLGHGWRITQTFLADAQGTACHPQKCQGIVLNDMTVRFKKSTSNLFRFSDTSVVSGVFVHSAYEDSSASHFFDDTQSEACDPVREISSFYHSLSEVSLSGVFGVGKRMKHERIGNGMVVSQWDSCATVLAVVINADFADHALVYFFELSNARVICAPGNHGQGRCEEVPNDDESVESQGGMEEIAGFPRAPSPAFYMVDLHGYLPSYQSRGLESWWINDIAWINSSATKSLFLGLVTRGGSIVVCSRVGRPVNMTCASVRPELQSQELPSKHLPLIVRESKQSARPLHFSISAHPNRPTVLVCDGLSVIELQIPIEEMAVLTMLSDPVRKLVNRATTRRSSVDGHMDSRNAAKATTAAATLSVDQILEGLYTCVAFPALSFDPALHSVLHVLQKQIPNAIRLSTMSLLRNSSSSDKSVSDSFSVDQSLDLTQRGLSQRAVLTAQACVKFIYDALRLLPWQKSFQTMFLDFANMISTVINLLIEAGAVDLAFSCLSDSEAALRDVFDGVAGAARGREPDLSFFGERQRQQQSDIAAEDSVSTELEVSFQFVDQWKRLCTLLEDDTKHAHGRSQDQMNRSLVALEKVHEKLSGFDALSQQELQLEHHARDKSVADVSVASSNDDEGLHTLTELEMSFVFRGRKLYLAKRRQACLQLLNQLRQDHEQYSEQLYMCVLTWLISMHLSHGNADVVAALQVAEELQELVIRMAAKPSAKFLFLLAAMGLSNLARAMSDYFKGEESIMLPVPLVLPGNDVRKALSGADKRFLMVVPCRALHKSVLESQSGDGFDKSFGEQFSSRNAQHTLGLLSKGWTVRRCVNIYRICSRPQRALELTQELAQAVSDYMAAQVAAQGTTSLSNPLSNVDALLAIEHPEISGMPSGKKLPLSMLAMASPFFISDAQPLNAMDSTDAGGITSALWANEKGGYHWTLRELLELSSALAVASSVIKYPLTDPSLNDLNEPQSVWPVIDKHTQCMTNSWDLHGILSLMHAHVSGRNVERGFGVLAFPAPSKVALTPVFTTLRGRCGNQCLTTWMDKVLMVCAKLSLVPTVEFPSYFPLPEEDGMQILQEESFHELETPLLGQNLGDGICASLAPLPEPMFLGDSSAAASPIDFLCGDAKKTESVVGHDRIAIRRIVQDEYKKVAAIDRSSRSVEQIKFSEEWFSAMESKLQSAVLGGTHTILHVIIRLLAIRCGDKPELLTREQNPHFKDHAMKELRDIMDQSVPQLGPTMFFLLVRQTLWYFSSILRGMAVEDSFPMHGAFGKTGSEVRQVEPAAVRRDRERLRNLREDVAFKCAVWALRLTWCEQVGAHFSRFQLDSQSVLLGFLLQSPTTPMVAKFVAEHVPKASLHASQMAAYKRLLTRFRMADMSDHKSEAEGMYGRIVTQHDKEAKEQMGPDAMLQRDPMYLRFLDTFCVRLVNYTLELPEDSENHMNVRHSKSVVGQGVHPEFVQRDSFSELFESFLADTEEWSAQMRAVNSSDAHVPDHKQSSENVNGEQAAELARAPAVAGTRGIVVPVITTSPVLEPRDSSEPVKDAETSDDRGSPLPASVLSEEDAAAAAAARVARAKQRREEEARERQEEAEERARAKARKIKRAAERIRVAKVEVEGERSLLEQERFALEQEKQRLQELQQKLAQQAAEAETLKKEVPAVGSRDIDFAALAADEGVDEEEETDMTAAPSGKGMVYYAPGTVMHGKPVTFDSKEAMRVAQEMAAQPAEEPRRSALTRKARTVRFDVDTLSSDDSLISTDSDSIAILKTKPQKKKRPFSFMQRSQSSKQHPLSISQVFPSVKHDRMHQAATQSIWGSSSPRKPVAEQDQVVSGAAPPQQEPQVVVQATPQAQPVPLVGCKQPIKMLFVPGISKHKGSSAKKMITPRPLSTKLDSRGLIQGAAVGGARMMKQKLGNRPALLRVSSIDARWEMMRAASARKEAAKRQEPPSVAVTPSPKPPAIEQASVAQVASQPAPVAGTRDIDFAAFGMEEEEGGQSSSEDIMQSDFVDTTVFYSSRPNSYEGRHRDAKDPPAQGAFNSTMFFIPPPQVSLPQTQRTGVSSVPDTARTQPSARIHYAPLAEEELAAGVIPVLSSSLPPTPHKSERAIQVHPNGVVPTVNVSLPPSVASSVASTPGPSRLYNDEETGAASDVSTPRVVRRKKRQEPYLLSPQSQNLVDATGTEGNVKYHSAPKNYYISDIMQEVALLKREQELQKKLKLVQRREEQLAQKADRLRKTYGSLSGRVSQEQPTQDGSLAAAEESIQRFLNEHDGVDATEILLRKPTMVRRRPSTRRPSAMREFMPHRLERDQERYREYKDESAIADIEKRKQLRVEKLMDRIYGSDLQRDQGFKPHARDQEGEVPPFQREALPSSVIGPRSGAMMYINPSRMRTKDHSNTFQQTAELDEKNEDVVSELRSPARTAVRSRRANSSIPAFHRIRSAPGGPVLDRPAQSYKWVQSELKTHHRGEAPYVNNPVRVNMAGDLMSDDMAASTFSTQVHAMDDRLSVIHQTAKALRKELVLKHSGKPGGGPNMYNLEDLINRQETARTDHLLRFASATLTGEGGPAFDNDFYEEDDELEREARALELALLEAEEQKRIARVMSSADLQVPGEEEPVKQKQEVVHYREMMQLPSGVRVPESVRQGRVRDEDEARQLVAMEIFKKLDGLVAVTADTRKVSSGTNGAKPARKKRRAKPTALEIKRLFDDTDTKRLSIQQLQEKLQGALEVLGDEEEDDSTTSSETKKAPARPASARVVAATTKLNVPENEFWS